MKIKLLTSLLIVLFYTNSYSSRYYVNSVATGNGNGLTWTNAFTDLQTALSISIFGDEIWVASGQYKPTISTDRTVSFVLKDGVNIFGGFSGNETNLSQRDLINNPTTLNGDIGQIGQTTDNSHNIIRANNLTSNIILDGFRIINGYSGGSYNGAGIKITNSSTGTLNITNCYFFSNIATNYGGAIYIGYSRVIIDKCEFRNNSINSGGDGGAIFTSNSNGASTLLIKETKFIGNTSRIGACLSNVAPYQSLIIDRCIFSNNTSQISIINIDTFNLVKILNSYFIGNTVNDFSSKLIYALHYSNNSTEDFEMINCTITNNYNIYTNTIQSEIIQLNKPYYKVRNCIIYGNTQYQGRQMTIGHSVSNCLIENGYSGGTSIINSNPLFINPNSTLNSNFDASNYNYNLLNNSPCINVGNNSFVNSLYNLDLNNSNRIQGTIVDIGSYESNQNLSVNNVNNNLNSLFYFDYMNKELNFLDLNILYNKNFEIYDSNGKLIVKRQIKNSKIQIELNQGIYFVKIENYKAIKIAVK